MLEALISQAPGFMLAAISFIGLLTVIVFIHEMGHFLVGRWCGAKIDVFSVGFGREIYGWNDKHGTRWRVAWIPMGGYVKFSGDANAASMPDENAVKDPTTFHGRPLWQRAAIVAAGPMANFLLSIVIFAGIYTIVGKQMIEPIVSGLVKDGAAEKAGILAGDKIISIDGSKVVSFYDIPRLISDKQGVEVSVTVKRNGEEIKIGVTPTSREVNDGMGGKIDIALLGVQRSVNGDVVYERKNIFQALVMGTTETWSIITRSLSYIKGMFVGTVSTDQLAGPIGIAQLTGNVASISFLALVQLGAILSISIGLINLFPIPMLDGGHLLYYLVEAVRGKALSQKAQEFGFMVGFAVVVSLMLFATKNDLFLRLGLFGS
ncbi:Intramembrane protease RasP/YluC, implicated in cell division based on FtsL cleavage [hydrothermal vent metagenome]|uniref:Intramembrane protease RasP/YluC, implicated in cell division based on FtsL cleavage n=1 Tax=hydrothermal vent metagenome TaxID=652676 RepID=A0A3B0S4V2_9ZZZZ